MSVHEYGYYWKAEQYDFLGGITSENIGSASFYIEWCFRVSNVGDTQTYLAHLDSNNYVRVGSVGGPSDLTMLIGGTSYIFPTGQELGPGDSVTLGIDYDPSRAGSEAQIYLWVADKKPAFGLVGSLSIPSFFNDFNTITRFSTVSLLSRVIVRAGGINGTETHQYNANYDRIEVGVFNVRSSTSAGKIWNINPTTERGSSTSDSVFELYNGVSEVNGQSATQTITFGDTAQTITVPPTLTSGELLFSGTPVTYTYDSEAGTATFNAPAMGDLPGLTTIGEGNTISFDGNRIGVTTAVPAPYDVVDLIGPIYTGESSYTYGSDFTPAASWQHVYNENEVTVYPDNQFDIVSTDGAINFTGYSVDPASGMQEYQVSNQGAGVNNPPTVNQTTQPQTVTVGEQINVSATASDYDTFQWTADLDGTFEDETALTTTFTTAEHGQLTTTATAINADGSRSDSVTHTVEAPVAMGEFTATHNNVPDGPIETVVVNLDTSVVLFNGSKTWSDGKATFSFENLAAGDRLQVTTINEPDGDAGLSVEYAA